MKKLFFSLSTFISLSFIAQNNVGIGTVTPNPQAILDIESNDKGVLISRLTTTARNTLGTALTNVEDGMLVYDKDLTTFFYWDGPNLQWVQVGSGTGDNWGTQVVQISGANISGDGTTANPLIVTEVDADITNEIQDLSLNSTTNILTITNNGNATNIDLSPFLDNTDAQDLSLSGDVLSLTGDGTNVSLSSLKDHDWYEVGGTTQPDAINDDIYTNGRVGIGTNTPSRELHVTSGLTYVSMFESTGASSGIALPNANSTVSTQAIRSSTNDIQIINDATAMLHIDGDVANYGYIGVGTTTPTQKLHIDNGTTLIQNSDGNYGLLQFDADGNNTSLISDFASISGHTGGLSLSGLANAISSPHLYISNNGDIGIGTITPTTSLDIVGDLKVSTITAGTSNEEVLVVDATGLVKKVAPSSPAGEVITFAGATAPSGFLLCDGSAVSRTTYADLFAAIGTTYGTGDGSTTFNLPDLRGEFIRGLDAGRGVDAGRTLASLQNTAAPNVAGQTTTGFVNSYDTRANDISGPIGNINGGTGATNSSGQSSSTGVDSQHRIVLDLSRGSSVYQNGINEVRPRNVAMNYCIRF